MGDCSVCVLCKYFVGISRVVAWWRDTPLRTPRRRLAGAERGWPFVSSAHASTATATACLYFLSAWYCSALPPRCIFLQICLWPRRQWSCRQVLLQYLVWHLTHRGALWASGAAQAAQVVRIILRFAASYWFAAA